MPAIWYHIKNERNGGIGLKKFKKNATAALMALIITFSSLPISIGAKSSSSGTYQCDWFDESIFYPYEYSDEWFGGSSYNYNHNLATLALNISLASFNSFDDAHRDENIRKMLEECGYNVKTYGYQTEGYDTSAVALAQKTVTLNGENCTLLIAAIRSGNYGMEWGGNMRVGTGENHLGFDLAKEIILNYLNDYFATEPLSGRVKLLISGYSRGGSIANLVGAELTDGSYAKSLDEADSIAKAELKKEDIFTFTFEAPRCTRKSTANDEIYGNIVNIINPNDYVPRFATDKWGFTRYGTEYFLPSADNCENYESYYQKAGDVFNEMMEGTGKKFSSSFYNTEDSRSVGAMLDSLMDKLTDEVLGDQATYSAKYEDGLIFVAGQYIGKKLGVGNAMKTLGVVIVGIATGLIPANMETIKSDGFRSYISEKIAESDAAEHLTKPQIQGMIDVFISLLEFVKNNRSDVLAFLGQLNTVLNVHQPYVNLSWMMAIDRSDLMKINGKEEKPLSVSFNSVSLKYKANAKIIADYDENAGTVTWKSSDTSVVRVDENGYLTAAGSGTAKITAELRSKDGALLDSEIITVTVHMNVLETFVNAFKNIFEKAAA